MAHQSAAAKRTRSEEALRASERKYRQLFNSMTEGFLLVEMILDQASQPVSYRYLDANPALERLTHLKCQNIIGRDARDVLGVVEPHWVEAFGRVALTGEPVHIEEHSEALGGWYDVYGYCPERGKAALIYTNVTERRKTEEALRRSKELAEAVNRISGVLHSTLDPDEVVRRIVVEGAAALGSDTAAISERQDRGWVVRYTHGMPPELVGQRLSDDQERHAVLAMETGQVVPVEDAFHDERFNREHLRRYNVHSVLVAPLIMRGKPFGTLFFNYHQAPHAFTEAEVSFARQLASSAASALENARLFEERKLAQEAVAASEAKYRRLHDSMREAFILVDMTGRIRECNSAFLQMVGYSEEEVLRLTYFDLTPEHWQAMEEQIVREQILTRGYSEVYEKEYRRKNGSVFPVELRTFLLRGEEGQPSGMWAIVRDITERQRVEGALRESEARFRIMADGLPLMIWVHDAQGRQQFVNRTFCEFFGVNAAEMAGEKWRDFVHPEDAPAYAAEFAACVREQRPFHAETRARRADGQWRWVESFACPRFSEAGEFLGMVGTSPDITERKQAEAVLARDRKELERLVAERTARLQELVGELEHFSYSITHDMRAPLRAMRGLAEVMNEGDAEWTEEERRKFIQRIITAAERMDALITDALNYSKAVRSELPLAPMDVGSLLEGMLETYPELQGPEVEITVERGLPLVMGNRAGLTQCFSNLLGNAVKFVKPGEKARVRVWGELRAGRVRLWVEDQGPGISASMLPRVFDMFAHGATPQAGTGIGLALVRKVVDRMGGRVGVESEPGQGSRFWVELESGELRRAPVEPTGAGGTSH